MHLWAKKAARQPGMTSVLLGAYVVLLVMLAEGMVRTLLHPGNLHRPVGLFSRDNGDDTDAHAPAHLAAPDSLDYRIITASSGRSYRTRREQFRALAVVGLRGRLPNPSRPHPRRLYAGALPLRHYRMGDSQGRRLRRFSGREACEAWRNQCEPLAQALARNNLDCREPVSVV